MTIKQFVKLKKVFDRALPFDTPIDLDVQDFTHYDERTSSFSSIDYLQIIAITVILK